MAATKAATNNQQTPQKRAFKDKNKPEQVRVVHFFASYQFHHLLQTRQSNMVAAKAVADAVRTSLGPKGMDKMIQVASCFSVLSLWNALMQADNGEVTITNDGATILNQMSVIHPTAKMVCFGVGFSCDSSPHPVLSWSNCRRRRTLRRAMARRQSLSLPAHCSMLLRKCWRKVRVLLCLFLEQSSLVYRHSSDSDLRELPTRRHRGDTNSRVNVDAC